MSGTPEPGKNRPRNSVVVGVVVLAIVFILAQVYVIPASSGFRFSAGRVTPTAEPDRISRADAASVLRRAVDRVNAGDRAGLCDMEIVDYRSSCQFDVRTLDQVTVSNPEVVGFRKVTYSAQGEAGAVLEICTKVNGQPLYSDYYVVERPDRQLVPVFAVYWIQQLVKNPGRPTDISRPHARSSMRFDPRCGPVITEADLTTEARG